MNQELIMLADTLKEAQRKEYNEWEANGYGLKYPQEAAISNKLFEQINWYVHKETLIKKFPMDYIQGTFMIAGILIHLDPTLKDYTYYFLTPNSSIIPPKVRTYILPKGIKP